MKARLAAWAIGAVIALQALPGFAQMGPPQPLPPEVLADTPDMKAASWLSAHIVAQGSVLGGMSFDFPKRFYKNRLFLLAESHGSAAPQVVDLELLTHLNSRIGLTDYLAEVDPVQGDQLNSYLDNGDEAVLDRVFDYWTKSGAQWGNTAFEDKVRAIRSLNMKLPAERRIHFIGIDAIQDWPLLREWVTAQGGVIDLAAWDAGDAKARSMLVVTALKDRASGAMGRRLVDLLTRTATGTDRETAIFETYAYAVRSGELGKRPAYGLWGMFHALQAPANGTSPFAARVTRSNLPAHNRVATIAMFSLDSATQIPVPLPTGLQRMRLTEFNVDGPYIKAQGAATLRAASKPDRILVFNLDGGTKWIRNGDFVSIRTSVGQNFALDPNLPSIDYAQYVGVFRGSDWAPPRKE